MKKKTKLIITTLTVFAALILVTVSCSTIAGCVTSSHESWGFVEAVGGIKVGEPHSVSPNNWAVPIECDTSGCTAVTKEPTTVNSALVIKAVKKRVKQDHILIWVVTCLVTDRYKYAHWTNDIAIKGIQPGTYKVQYLNPDGSAVDIRSIELR
jgi:hypothetical protein